MTNGLDICQRNVQHARERACERAAAPVVEPTSTDRLRTALIFVNCRSELFRPDFREWLSKNIHVWDAFEREANKVWERGHRHYSARTIGEYLRHETLVAERSLETRLTFKVNDHYWPDLARLYGCFHADRAEFFERRPGQSAVRTA